MKRGRLTAATVAAISIPALGLAVGAITSGAQAASRAPGARLYSEQTVAVSCQGRPQVRPASFTLACADANDYLARLSWTSWSPALATATGVQEENDCIPDCVAGHFRAYPVDVIFWQPGAIGGQPGSERYTKVTVLYPGARPDSGGHQAATFSTSLP